MHVTTKTNLTLSVAPFLYGRYRQGTLIETAFYASSRTQQTCTENGTPLDFLCHPLEYFMSQRKAVFIIIKTPYFYRPIRSAAYRKDRLFIVVLEG